ncbi:hypothetical protein CASFOL_034230 [Castilleja foliolosa]|uniref:Transcription elongation factor n=1 Tax=Castilleja foliolosa TaxID=1961234 RepID=A0ABD3BXL3_9LAMI
MEKELTELFESVKRAADASVNSPAEEDRCLDALERLKKFPVNYQVLVSTQVGKRLRQLTKHSSDKIKTVASDVVEIWKGIIVKETTKAKKNGSASDCDSGKAESADTETNSRKNIQRSNSIKSDQNSAPKKQKIEKMSTVPNPDKPTKTETSTSVKIEKSKVVQTTTTTKTLHLETKVKVEKSSSGVGPLKLTSLVYCKDSDRDTIRDNLAEALCKVPSEVNEPDHKERVKESDPYLVAVMVETAMFEKWGKSKGPQKVKYRSLLFNIRDKNNPDFRRKVLIGDIEPHAILELTPEEMASDERQQKNAEIKQKALFNSERAAAPKASTNEFTCGRCKKKETTYYQMQTRSADEPMTTFVTCVNCNNHWKFC